MKNNYKYWSKQKKYIFIIIENCDCTINSSIWFEYDANLTLLNCMLSKKIYSNILCNISPHLSEIYAVTGQFS